MRYSHTIGSRPTIEQQLSLTERRRRLQTKIDSFVRRGAPYTQANPSNPNNQVDDEWVDVDDVSDDILPAGVVSSDLPAVVDSTHPEQQSLPLPSSFLPSSWTPIQKHLAVFEYELRIGQARDALHHLRIAIALKSFIYRSRIRKNAPTSNYVRRLRSYGDANAAHMSIAHAAKVYSTARRAIRLLSPNSTVPPEFCELTRQDLVASTAIANSNESGQGKKPLSWIWHTVSNHDDPVFVAESTLFNYLVFYYH